MIFNILFHLFSFIVSILYIYIYFLGEPLTIQEAFTYMKFLIGFEGNFDEISHEQEPSMSVDLSFLPEVYLLEIFLMCSYYLIII